MGKIGIEDLDIAISETGIEDYMDQLKIEILDDMETALEAERDAIIEKVSAGWIGKSEEAFEKQLKEEIESIEEDLKEEYKDLKARLKDLANFYYNQDEKMM